jgi:hypothetical protein
MRQFPASVSAVLKLSNCSQACSQEGRWDEKCRRAVRAYQSLQIGVDTPHSAMIVLRFVLRLFTALPTRLEGPSQDPISSSNECYSDIAPAVSWWEPLKPQVVFSGSLQRRPGI